MEQQKITLELTQKEFWLIQSALEETIEVLSRRIEKDDRFTHPADAYLDLLDELQKIKRDKTRNRFFFRAGYLTGTRTTTKHYFY